MFFDNDEFEMAEFDSSFGSWSDEDDDDDDFDSEMEAEREQNAKFFNDLASGLYD